ncbi:unnamed protein product [Blepharisma stoltei]|uniref:RRM domain-containing protein n=1 Tax=Blepharisma stoltei TaxID=1481888 RepID=A0AAU9K6E3_9CILI|nr:unnamed protein product [Blepharisma stoltei]
MWKQGISESNNQPELIKHEFSNEIPQSSNPDIFTSTEEKNLEAKAQTTGKTKLSDSVGYSKDFEEAKNEEIHTKPALSENIKEGITSASEEEIKPKIELKEWSNNSKEEKKEEIFELPPVKTFTAGTSQEEIKTEIEVKKGKNLSLNSKGYSNSSKKDTKETPAKKAAQKVEIETSSDSEEEFTPKKGEESSSDSEEEPNQTEKKIIWDISYGTGPVTEIFVGNLSYQTKSSDLDNFFSRCGEVSSVKLLYTSDGNPKGIANVSFTNIESTNKALELNGAIFMGRNLRVLPSISKPLSSRIAEISPSQDEPEEQADARLGNGKSTTIFARNLSYASTIDSIRKFFEICGEIKDIRVALDSEGNHKGFAFIEFFNIEAAEKAIELNGRKFDGRIISLDFSGNSTSKEISI